MSSIEILIDNATNLEELRLKKRWKVKLPEESNIGDILSKLNLDRLKEDDGSISSLVMFFKNNKSVKDVDEKLEDGDKLKIMPLASGG